MISYQSTDGHALEIIRKAFLRSFGDIVSVSPRIFVFISPTDESYHEIQDTLSNGHKVIVLGSIGDAIAGLLGLTLKDHESFEASKASLKSDHEGAFHVTEYRLGYHQHELTSQVPYGARYFARFDFTDEWNNHGYGRITLDGTIWSLSHKINNENALSLVNVIDNNGCVSEFATLKDFENSSVLYINRPVGFVDGLDWTIIENFLCRYRIGKLASLPLILDLPKGARGVVSARLDCDQSIINAKPLVELYKNYEIDISLGISTGISIEGNEIDFLNEFHSSGGSLVSHTVMHHYSWGRDYEHALAETKESKQWLETHVKGLCVNYAVSPFHSNEPFAVQALADAGYKGFISGIIHNDPEYLIGVSGEVPFVDKKIISHSQQCMMHGDCFHRYGNSIQPYIESFEMHLKAEKLFGYLDHPFGGYDYGWNSEEERLNAHEQLIKYIQSHNDIFWMTLEELLDFIVSKSEVKMEILQSGELLIINQAPNVVIEYQGQKYEN